MSTYEGRSDPPRVLVVGGGEVSRAVSAVIAPMAGATTATCDRALQGLLRRDVNVAVVDLCDGNDGVVAELAQERPDLPVVALVRPGATRTAVDAMRQGAIDALEWPADKATLLAAVGRRLAHRHTGPDTAYEARLEIARRQILERAFAVAHAQSMRAISLDARRPEAFNLLGVIEQARGRRIVAQTWWRMALLLDGAYEPARANLTRSTRRPAPAGGLELG